MLSAMHRFHQLTRSCSCSRICALSRRTTPNAPLIQLVNEMNVTGQSCLLFLTPGCCTVATEPKHRFLQIQMFLAQTKVSLSLLSAHVCFDLFPFLLLLFFYS